MSRKLQAQTTCQHVPENDGKPWYPGKTAKCVLCGINLVGINNPPCSRVRMSKKDRKRQKCVLKKTAVKQLEKEGK